ncbi:MAG: DUF1850 domain-containing protein, partial [Syntrophaceae bacterium]|nr:DUF1850 domain-containing protein [Syntrophaceae bacterium]
IPPNQRQQQDSEQPGGPSPGHEILSQTRRSIRLRTALPGSPLKEDDETADDRYRRARVSGRFFLFYPLHPVLRITAVKTGEPLFCTRVGKGEEFTLSFTHSVNRRPVYDVIRVEGDHLLILRSRFDSLGAGMPDGSSSGMRLQFGSDGWLEAIVNRPVSEITFFVGWVANHSLSLRGRDIALADLAQPGTLLALGIKRVSHYGLWKSRCVR